MPERTTLAAHPAFAGLPAGARVLVLAPRAVVEALGSSTSWRIETTDRLDALPFEAGSLDAAIVSGGLERHEWDRWLLQQVHLALRPGAPLLVDVPDLGAILSPGGAGFLLGRALQRVRHRLGAPRARAFAGRRYRRGALERVLDALHFERRGPARAVAGGRFQIVATRQPGLAARLRAGGPPEPTAFVRDFELENERFVRIRDEWAARHPHLAGARREPFDPAAHAGQNVLVLAPHADDELVGAAGTLLRLRSQGARLTVVHATDGGASAALLREPDAVRTTVRLAEAREVGAALGAGRLEFWRQDNRAFRVTDDTVSRLRALLDDLRPGLVITPFVTDIHPDHFTLNRILEGALRGAAFDAGRCRVLYSEIWSLVPATCVSDVTALEEEVERLIRLYLTAMKVDDLPHLCERRYYHNACRYLERPGFAEAFFDLPASRHAELMATAGGRHG